MKGFGIIQNELGRNACGKNCNTGVCLGGQLNKLFSLQESKKPVRVIVRFPHCNAQLIISLPLCCTFKTSNPKTFKVSLSILIRKLAASIAAQLCHQKEFAEKLLLLLGSFSSHDLKSYHSKHNSHFEKPSLVMVNNGQQEGFSASACTHRQHAEKRKSEKTTSQSFYYQLQSAKESQQFGGIDNFVNEISNSLVFISIRLLSNEESLPIEINESTMETEITVCDLQNIEVQLGQISPFLVEQIQLNLEEQDRKDLDLMKHHRQSKERKNQKKSSVSSQNNLQHIQPLNLKKTQRYQSNESKDLWNYSSDLPKPNKDTRINNNNSSDSSINHKQFQFHDESDKEFNSTGFSSLIDRSLNFKEKSHQHTSNSCKDSPWLSPIISKSLKRQFSDEVFKFETPVQKKIKSNNSLENYHQQKQYARRELEDAEIELSYERFVQEMSNSTACSSGSQVNGEKQTKIHNNKDISVPNSAQSTSLTLISQEQFPVSDFLESDQELLRNSLESIMNPTRKLQDTQNQQIKGFKKPNHSKRNNNNNQQQNKNETLSKKLGQVSFKEDEILSSNKADQTSLLSTQSSYMLPSKLQHFSQRVKQFKQELLCLGEIIMATSTKNAQNFLNQTDLSRVIKQMIHKFSLFPLDIQLLITDLVRICPAWLSTTNTKYGTVLTCNNSSFKLENLQRTLSRI